MIGEDRKRRAEKKALLQSVQRTELKKPKKEDQATGKNAEREDESGQDDREVLVYNPRREIREEAEYEPEWESREEAEYESGWESREEAEYEPGWESREEIEYEPRQKMSSAERRRRRRRRHRRKRLRRFLRILATVGILAAAILLLTFAVGKTTGSYGLNGFKEFWSTMIHGEFLSGLGSADTDDGTDSESGVAADGESGAGMAAESGADASDESAADATEAETSPYVGELPDIDINSWEYLLVNTDNPIGEYEPEIADCGRIQLDTRIVEAMNAFVEAAKAQGLPVYLSSGYRSYSTQTMLFNRKISQGYSEEKAATIVARPGTSEHQTGLAADITDVYRETKNEALEDTETYKWMSAHCQEYGFIVRFPKDKEDITGIIYEPWHFRYVGVEAATFIMNNNLCLEEFVELYK